MNSKQKLVAMIGIALIMLSLWEGYQPELKALI
jgi:hypothetical protein